MTRKRTSDLTKGVTKNIRPPLKTQVLDPKPKCVLCVSQALGPLESLSPRNARVAEVYVTPLDLTSHSPDFHTPQHNDYEPTQARDSLMVMVWNSWLALPN
ncbi:hypothetical protein TNCV_4082371 [Trichonephila clavipes]|nr:hypothetical protein TNCV_4082371 [Trichonephila clavipes]